LDALVLAGNDVLTEAVLDVVLEIPAAQRAEAPAERLE
jgi:hypothetical protein